MSSLLELSGKVVLVTGSTKHIGRATALLFAEHGATVIVNSRNVVDIERTVNEFRVKGHVAEGICADVSKEKDVDELMAKISKQFGRLDVVVNNAANIPWNNPIETCPSDQWDEVFHTNLYGTFYVCRSALPMMKQKESGAIINISSGTAFGKDPFVSSLPYASSKGALISFTKGLAREVCQHGVRVNAVVFSTAEPDDRTKYPSQRIYQKAIETSPLRRLTRAEEIASIILFLASDMSSAVTGEVIALGGISNSTTAF
ncbi:MAG: hypothetical protein A3D65_00750 [Candidatus Lloydbacteria bacterium RIFCSPHIGHO2_02_FULL_50_13]|uniref:Ketoreductase domain-containing protein n=1 Tax=Candidatus Lloydbacteria bacterium RIFCSPHIGHO2_02_FULL_50_13 TaxID=1798661 RepID=A0A1G2D0P6_9BACT|nr:MAG: hypothetical protein A3D65_00750 [Candidatus Lloydbacteria bacterium RIFCSPHIGHO2_02_FULL_50_13]